MTEAIFRKLLVLQNGLSHEHLCVSFPDTFLWLIPKISLNDNFVWCKNSRVIKDLSNSGSFFLFSVPKLFLILSARKFDVFLWKYSLQKKSVKLERLLCKDKSSQKFHESYSWRNLQWSSYHLIQPLRLESKYLPRWQWSSWKQWFTIPATVQFSCCNKNA